MARFEPPRGTHDILPSEQPLWQRVVGEAEELCRLYGYRRIQTPAFEETGLFARTSGEASDLVQKEMYSFEDRSGRPLTLRAEATAPICRAYVTHGLHTEPQPQKLYTLATMYRYARPQKGRYREHWQLSVEAIGSDDPALDAEVIQLYDALLRRLGVSEYRLELNSIGDAKCRPAYVERLRAWFDEHAADLDDDTRTKAQASPMLALDNFSAKPAAVQDALRDAPRVGDSLCPECVEHFAAVRAALDAYGVRYDLVPTLVRGLDYYTRTTWEFIGPEHGAQSVISGGGRYDGLIEAIGGPPTPGVGFGAGIERLLIALDDAGVTADAPRIDVFFALEPDAPRADVLRWLMELRAAGVAADTDYAGRSLKGQLTQASRSSAHTTVIVGPERITLRRQGEADEEVERAELVARLSR